MKNIFRKRTPLFLCTLFLCIFLPAILLCSHCFDRALFHKITSAYVQSSLEHDALSLHFVMAYPNLQGIHLKDAALPVYSKEASEASAASRQKFLSVLSFLDSKKLNEEERYTYDLLCDRLALDLEESDFSYYEEPLSPTSGMQSELLLLFAEYPFYTADDVETYLSLLQSVPDYVQGLLSYESEKSAAGLFMEKEDAKKSAQQCREILTKEALSSGTHFLQTTFSSRLASLLQKGLLTAKQQSQYEAQNTSRFCQNPSCPPGSCSQTGWNSFPTPDARGEDFPRSPTGGNIMPGSSRNPPVPLFPWISSICSFKNSFRKPTKR